MTPLQAIILGLVEGITEYLPVSSTGHLILVSELLKLDQSVGKETIDDFNIVIQGGAILAVVLLYWPRFVRMLMGLLGRDAAGLRLFINIVIAFMPAAIVGLVLHKWIKAQLFHAGPVIAALALGGVFMIAVDRLVIARRGVRPAPSAGGPIAGSASSAGRSLDELTPAQALFIGCMQIVAMWPGTSRSMMTITGGVLAGLTPAAAAEFSFLLGMPTLLAATGLDLVKNLKQARETGEPNMFEQIGYTPSAIGLLVAAISAAIAVKWLVGFLNRHGLLGFGVYRIALAAVLAALIARGIVTVG